MNKQYLPEHILGNRSILVKINNFSFETKSIGSLDHRKRVAQIFGKEVKDVGWENIYKKPESKIMFRKNIVIVNVKGMRTWKKRR